jgi:hypothetical protein
MTTEYIYTCRYGLEEQDNRVFLHTYVHTYVLGEKDNIVFLHPYVLEEQYGSIFKYTCVNAGTGFKLIFRSSDHCDILVHRLIGGCFTQGCQIFLGPNIPKRKNIPNDHKLYQKAIYYTHKLYQMAVKYSKWS